MENRLIQSIDVFELERRRTKLASLFLLDVRTEEEVEICRLPGSVSIPVRYISARLGEIPIDKDIIIYCHHGIRSLSVFQYLLYAGFDPLRLFNLKGGIAAYSKYIDQKMPQY